MNPTSQTEPKYQFASDNTAGVPPEAWNALAEANAGFVPSYGNDVWTARAADAIREAFEKDCDVYFVFNGTAANSLALASLCQSYHSVICHESAHIETDECGAPEFYSNGTKILVSPGASGKLVPSEIERLVKKRNDIHYPKPRVVSLTQATELGTVYRPEEIQAIALLAKGFGLRIHMDGSRLANAAAFLGKPLRSFTWEAGVDVLCLGGTKAGAGFSEAVVFFNKSLSEEFAYRCKQAGQLASKMRYLSAPWITMLKGGHWLRYAHEANARAKKLSEALAELPGVRLLQNVEANGVFAELPAAMHQRLKEKNWIYYTFIGGGARFMCSWQTRDEDLAALLADAAG